MSTITDLPCEVIAMVLQNLGDVRFLLPALLTCRHFYSSFKEHPHVAAHILRQQVTPALVPYSVAALDASHLTPRTTWTVRDLLGRLYADPSQFATRLRTMSLPLLTGMAHKHEIIHTLATAFANRAWAHLSNEQNSRVSGDLSLSLTEYFRFCRAFYRADLYFSLFRASSSSDPASISQSDEQWFVSKHPPWENEQLGCVHDFLEFQLAGASYDVLAHDVEFGELGIDYLSPANQNGWRQLWLSQGVEFIYRLMNENSYDAKKALLKSAFDKGSADLYDTLGTPPDEDLDDDTRLADYTDKDLRAIFPPPDAQDTDNGPFEAWRVVFYTWPRTAWVLLINNFRLRECAYVFWDYDRLRRYNMLELFDNVSEGSDLDPIQEDYDEMQESFEERSKIWQKGGTGYWAKDLESRIVWPRA